MSPPSRLDNKVPEYVWTRRNFLKISGLALGAITLPAWVPELESAEAATDKEGLADIALSAAKKLGATYADIRINRYRNEFIATREKQVQQVSRSQSFGFGVRVLAKGAWGFASSRQVDENEVQRVTAQAVEIALATARYQRRPVALAAAPKSVANWKSSLDRDPFDVPLADKIDFLLKVNETALRVKGTSFVNSSLNFVNEQKFYASSDGSRIEQYIIRSLPVFTVTAVDPVRGD